MTLSFQFKESVKTALAMTIAYWIALSMDWDRPYWAGFAVAFISLATLGQSLNKGALRMAGTLMGMVVALTLIALFAQDRWLLMLFLSAWVGLCTYMMGGTKHLYFWHVSSFVCVIIAVDAGPNSIDAFNTALMFPVMFVPLLLTAYLPFDLRPDQAFLRLVGRYFRSGEYLLSSMRWDPGRSLTRLDGWRRAFHARELASLPKKLGAWARFVDTKSLPGTSPDQLQALVTSLQALTFRMQELLELRGSPQAQFLVQELLMDFRAWRLRVQGAFQRLSQDPTVGEADKFRAKLDEILGHLETPIAETLDKAAEGQIGARDGENFYRLLGAYRGVSEALVDYAGNAGAIDWARWREARF